MSWTCTNCRSGKHADCSNEREARGLQCEIPERLCICWRFDAVHSPERYGYKAPFSADEQNDHDKVYGIGHVENWQDREEMRQEMEID